ncbi:MULTISPECIES: hypothetical protein [unclassified Mesorhizobium]|uniref:hypothetical protein n=1 Tax=unclassified Mesorhizobium TaxID=325217 RepID=UPI0015E2D3C6|nr:MULTISPECIES: hypothetical protein [unclassified Mesorhizobium]MBZ9703071.1 hypothetical protein [Mesorhizobium sp. CO1-1-3]MBZ9949827.1 hypothetical protein [Mesorhizobium sp. BR1-1-11]
MKESPGNDDQADDTRFNETLKRMLKTPPRPKSKPSPEKPAIGKLSQEKSSKAE